MVLSRVQEPDTEVLSSMLEAIEEIVDITGPELLSLEQLGGAFERFKVVLETSTQRRHERLQRRQAEDFDEDEAEALEVGLPRAPPHNPIVLLLCYAHSRQAHKQMWQSQ